MKQVTCTRCNGKGKVNFGHVAGRICFLCKGEGFINKDSIGKNFKVTLKGFFLPDHDDEHFVNVKAKSEGEALRKAKVTFIKIAKHINSNFVISTRQMVLKEL